MGELRNFYCVDNSCARITWRPHQKKIRYKYPSDSAWTYVDGDSYEIEDNLDVDCEGTIWYYEFTSTVCNEKSEPLLNSDGSTRIETLSIGIRGTVTNINYPEFRPFKEYAKDEDGNTITDENGDLIAIYYDPVWTIAEISYINWDAENVIAYRSLTISGSTYALIGSTTYTREIFSENNPTRCGKCFLKIYQQDRPLQEISDENNCPTAEQINDYLPDTFNEIIVEKLPVLERVEVVDYGYTLRNTPGFPVPIPYQYEIPSHCLNIYLNSVALPVPPDFPSYSKGNANDINPYAQICSDEGCPPPEFEVSCDCDCRECPDGTCATECDGYICCNDTATGQLIESIPINEYCQ